MIEALFGAKYFGFIAGAYGVVILALVLLTMSIWLTSRRRRAQLAKLEEAGLRRASKAA
ncbi:heme exporter protein CcmD [Ahrensia sp. R2A130]|uniref:heme exporter protein CcmD n=1 Tax=Ahrensia sp. R2A130 TaxID=744979 RepID=UPI0001E0A462|nr:heme exporter protein CcmD [Ahrensia sp. R2A130]EFL89644.1 conserved domain protein [Ahrensia sp. R2A130]